MISSQPDGQPAASAPGLPNNSGMTRVINQEALTISGTPSAPCLVSVFTRLKKQSSLSNSVASFFLADQRSFYPACGAVAGDRPVAIATMTQAHHLGLEGRAAESVPGIIRVLRKRAR
jgi:hypothetical protein